MLYVDSREHWTHPGSTDTHIKDYFDRHGIEYEIRKLDVADYSLSERPGVVIDRKSGMEELSRNLMNRADSSRFWREIRRAHAQKIRMFVLIESGKIKNINDVARWKSKYSPVSGRRLLDEMIRVEMAYGVIWKFCDRRSTARRIVEILNGKE